MKRTIFLILAALASTGRAATHEQAADSGWMRGFDLSKRTFLTSGSNTFFILEPGFQTVLAGKDGSVTTTVLNETIEVAGVTTRIVEEREEKDGKPAEVSRNYFAICKDSADVFYFGEDVDIYEDGKINGHSGAWLAGVDGAKPGMVMPGAVSVAMKYYQEEAPGKAMDRAEVMSLSETFKTPAGTFTGCLRTRESSELDPKDTEFKTYAPGIGLVQDEDLLLTRHGMVTLKE